MPSFKLSVWNFGKSLPSPGHPNVWNWIATIYLIQTFASLVVMQLLDLRFAEVAVPIVFLVLGASVAFFFRWCELSNSLGTWKWWAPVIFYAIFVFSLSNRSYPGALPTFNTKVFHPIEYITLGIFLSVAWHNFSKHKNASFLVPCVLISGILFAISDEIHQAFVPGRSARISDVLIDSVGIALGCGIFLLTTHTRNQTKDEHVSQSCEGESDQPPPLLGANASLDE
jgi:VanZ family protein